MAAISATIIGGLLAASGGMSAYNQYQAGQAQNRMGKYQAKVLNANASTVDQQAVDAIARGVEAQGRQRGATRDLIGAQRTAYAGQGLRMDTGGSVSEVNDDTVRLGELDTLTIANNAQREALGFRAQAADLRNQARLVRKGGKYAARAGTMQGISTIVGTAANTTDVFTR